MFAIIFSIICIAAGIFCFVICRKMKAKFMATAILVGCILLAAITMFMACTSTVPTGYTGILSTFGRVEEDVSLANGLNFIKPWQTITTMNNQKQKSTHQGSCFSLDLQEVFYTYTANHSLLPSAAPNIYKTVGVNYYEILLRPQIDNAIKTEFGLIKSEVMTNLRAQTQKKVSDYIHELGASYGIEIDVIIDDFDFTDAYTNAVEAKQVAEQEALRDKTQQQMETERSRQLAERTKIQAENDAAIRKINADADAEAAKVKAQADYEVAQLEADAIAYKGQKEAEAIAAQAAAITDNIVAYQYAQNWSGELPTYMMGTSALPIIDIPMGEE